MGWHKKSFCSVKAAAGTGFLGVFWDPDGRHWGCGREGIRERTVHDQTDRQTDIPSSLCLYKCVTPKIPGILLQMGKHPSINEDLANVGKQCILINKLVLVLTHLPDISNAVFWSFFPVLKYFYLQPPAPWKLFEKEKRISLEVCFRSIPSLYRPTREKIKSV